MAKTEETAVVTATTEQKYDPWKDMREIMLPRAGNNEQQFQYVGVNGRTFQVPRGKRTEVPRPVYECLMEAQQPLRPTAQASRNNNIVPFAA